MIVVKYNVNFNMIASFVNTMANAKKNTKNWWVRIVRVRLKNNKPNSAQRRVLYQECVREFDNLLATYNKQVALQVMHILRFDFGWGQQRLQKFSDKLAEMQIKTIDRYEATDGEVADICEIQLRDSGIDVKSLLKE